MATTSPDNIRTPNPNDNFNLVADWATTASDVQAALVKRANMYVGTAAQRAAFTTAPEGTHWQDTDGDKIHYVRQAGAWIPTPFIQKGTFTLPAINGNTLGSTVNVTFPTAFPSTPRSVTLNCTGFRIQLNWNHLTATGMSVYPANFWGSSSPAGETVTWSATL